MLICYKNLRNIVHFFILYILYILIIGIRLFTKENSFVGCIHNILFGPCQTNVYPITEPMIECVVDTAST
jgi:hypothetical protein